MAAASTVQNFSLYHYNILTRLPVSSQIDSIPFLGCLTEAGDKWQARATAIVNTIASKQQSGTHPYHHPYRHHHRQQAAVRYDQWYRGASRLNRHLWSRHRMMYLLREWSVDIGDSQPMSST